MIIPIENPVIKNGRCLNIAQYWGENKELYLKNFGIAGHNGLDFAYLNPDFLPPGESSYGKPILAAFAGKVKTLNFEGEHSTKGNGIYVKNDSFEAVYWHLSKLLVNQLDIVKEGQKIGEMGNSGYVFPAPSPAQPFAGTHLHFGIRPLKNNESLFPDNGFDGFVDPLPFLRELNMLNLYGDSKTKEVYVQDVERTLHRISNLETLNDLDAGGLVNKDAIVWLDPNDLASVYKIGNTWLSYNDN